MSTEQRDWRIIAYRANLPDGSPLNVVEAVPSDIQIHGVHDTEAMGLDRDEAKAFLERQQACIGYGALEIPEDLRGCMCFTWPLNHVVLTEWDVLFLRLRRKAQ